MDSTALVRPVGVHLTARPVPGAPSPASALRRLAAKPGLVVLSGAWVGGGVVIADDPVEVATGSGALAHVFGSTTPGSGSTTPGSGSTTPRGGSTTLGNEGLGIGGGWFGWLGYPDGAASWFGRYPNVLHYSQAEQCWYDEALSGVVDAPELDDRRRSLAALVAADCNPIDQRYRVGRFTANQSTEQYTAAVERCIDHIRAGDVYQANICLRLDATFEGSVTGLFADLLEALDPAYAALVCDNAGAVVSLSPELFLHRRGRTVTSAPIKGTRPRTPGLQPEADPERQALQTSEKERAENVMIVDLIRNDLARVAEIGSVRVPSLLQVAEQCGVWHMISTVSATVRGAITDEALLRATFPPGSVAGAPKLAAQAIIDALEPDLRGVYTGAVGYVSPVAGLELNVAIRTLRIAGDRVSLGVGAGITAGSTPAEEWWECFDKAAPVATAAGALVDVPGHRRRPVSTGGVFETMLVHNGRVVELTAHLDRMARSARQLWGSELPPTVRDDVLAHAAARGAPPVARLRLDLTANGRLRFHCTPAAAPLAVGQQPGLVAAFVTVPDGFGWHKIAERDRLDRLERTHPGRVVIAVDERRYCLESTRGNVLAFLGDRVITPPLDGRILPGVTRRAVLDLASDQGRPVEYRPILLDDLAKADGLAICGSLTGLRWVRECSLAQWAAPPPAVDELSAALLASWLGTRTSLARGNPVGVKLRS